ncbi:MAG: hypothetical protein RL637_725, partial [Pseudomonadota bacterium]
MLKVKLICLLGLLGLSYQGLTLAESTLNFKETLQSTVRKPAEWEAQEAIWLIWPNFNFLKSKPVVNVHLQIIKSLANHVKVNLIVQNQREIELAKHALTKRHIAYDHVNFKIIPHFDIWIRDFGAIFVKTADNQLNVVDLNFNVWGYETPTSDIGKLNESIDRTIAQQLKLPTLKTSMIMEGGGLEFNGSGTVITTESVIFDRNPLMSKSEVESEFNRLFGAKNVIWLKKGLAEDDRTNLVALYPEVF